ncbi:MAG: hypothetical protein ACI91F_002399, partial [Candidatus Binatia bacterium]
MDRSLAPTSWCGRLLLTVTLFTLLPTAPAFAAEICFGLAPTDGCRVNGVVGPCIGTFGKDRIRGTRGDDVIVALGGDDRVNGSRGNDRICGGDGNDRLRDGVGNDRLDGQAGDDTLNAGRD